MIFLDLTIGFLMLLGYYYVFVSLEKDKNIKLSWKKIIILFFLAIGTYLINFISIIYIKFILIILILYLNYFFCINRKFSDAIVSIFMIYIINSLIDWLYCLFFSQFSIKYESHIIFNLYSILLVLIVLILVNIPLINRSLNKLKKLILNINNNVKYIILFTFFYIFINTLMLSIFINNYSVIMQVVFFFSCVVIFIIFQSLLVTNNTHTDNIKNLFKLNVVYSNIIEEDKVYKHNIKNKLLTIKNIGDKNVKKIVDNILYDTKSKFDHSIQLDNIPPELIGTIGDKLFNCKKTSIIINNQLKKPIFEFINMKKYYILCESLGIILDNAVEAIENIKKGYIHLDLIQKNNTLEVVIKNNFSGTLDINLLGNKNYSTKNRESGLGLHSISKQKLITINYQIRNNEFITTLKLK